MSTLSLDGPYGLLNVLGPQIIGGCGQALLLGFALEQVTSFARSAATDSCYLKATVFLVTVFSLLQACLTISDWWRLFVSGFGDPVQAFQLGFSHKLAPVSTCLIAVPVHIYFICRCRNVTNGNKFILAPLLLLVITNIVSSIKVSHLIFSFTNRVSVSADQMDGYNGPFDPFDRQPSVDPTVIVWLISIAVLDMTITAVLLSFLIRSRHKSQSRYLHEVIEGLIQLVWGCAVPPCFCAITTCIIYTSTTMSGYISFWTFFPLDLIGPLYAISLLITLNSRTDPHGEDSSLAPTSAAGSEIGHEDGVDAPRWLSMKTPDDLNGRFTPVLPRTPRKAWRGKKMWSARLTLRNTGSAAAATMDKDRHRRHSSRNDADKGTAVEMGRAMDSMSMLGGERYSFASFHTPRSSFSLVSYPNSPGRAPVPSPSPTSPAYALAPTSPVTTLPSNSPTSLIFAARPNSPIDVSPPHDSSKSPSSPTSPSSDLSLGSPTYSRPTYGLVPISHSSPVPPCSPCVQVIRTCTVGTTLSVSTDMDLDDVPTTRSWVSPGPTAPMTEEERHREHVRRESAPSPLSIIGKGKGRWKAGT